MKIIVFPVDAELIEVYERMVPSAAQPSANAEASKKVVLTWRNVLAERLCDPLFGATLANLLTQSKIFRASEKVGEDRVLKLEDSDWELLLRATEMPTGGYRASAGLAALPFFEAIKHATTE